MRHPASLVPLRDALCSGCSIKAEAMPMENIVVEKQQTDVVNETNETAGAVHQKVKFEVFGEEMLEKHVRASGNSGRVYLPPDWVGHRVKIIRID